MTTAERRRLALVKVADLITEATEWEKVATLRRIDFRVTLFQSKVLLFVLQAMTYVCLEIRHRQ